MVNVEERFSSSSNCWCDLYVEIGHMVDDKMHAFNRAILIITQQPLGGKAQFGGRLERWKFGHLEMGHQVH
jgi:DNA-directed RNA polymerase beta subunit